MNWLWIVQIGADIILIGVVMILLLRLKSLGDIPRVATPANLERFIADAQNLTAEFDRLLSEKRELVNTTLATLDARIAEISEMAGRAEAALAATLQPPIQPPPQPASTPAVPGVAGFRARVLELHDLGLDSALIAKETGRPRGEVDLVLGLTVAKQSG